MKKGFYKSTWDFLGVAEEIELKRREQMKNCFDLDEVFVTTTTNNVKRSIETTNPYLEAMITIERDRVNKELLKGYSYYGSTPVCVDMSTYLPKPKHMMLNGDYTTIVWEDGTSTVLHLKPGEPYDPEKAILYGVLKRIFHNKNADMDRYLREFFDHAITCNKDKKDKKKKTEGSITVSLPSKDGAKLYYNDSIDIIDCSSEET